MTDKPDTTDLLLLRQVQHQGHDQITSELFEVAALEIERLHRAIDRIMVGGNHLATHIDPDGPDWRASHDDALTHYGAGLPYDAWCCWKTIMLVREDLKRD